MITTADFLRALEAIRAEAPAYRLGGDASDGTCDCIGLIIGALRRCGAQWEGVHGSNYAARQMMASLEPLNADALRPGFLVYKARQPGDKGYALPDRYRSGDDMRDYYHVGVVLSAAPLEILHCTTGGGANGIVTDTRPGQWAFAGPLCLVADETDGEWAALGADSGSSVNLRRQPEGALICRIPLGERVQVLSRQKGWARILWQGKTGFVKTEFLTGGAAEFDLLTELKALIARFEGRDG